MIPCFTHGGLGKAKPVCKPSFQLLPPGEGEAPAEPKWPIKLHSHTKPSVQDWMVLLFLFISVFVQPAPQERRPPWNLSP